MNLDRSISYTFLNWHINPKISQQSTFFLLSLMAEKNQGQFYFEFLKMSFNKTVSLHEN